MFPPVCRSVGACSGGMGPCAALCVLFYLPVQTARYAGYALRCAVCLAAQARHRVSGQQGTAPGHWPRQAGVLLTVPMRPGRRAWVSARVRHYRTARPCKPLHGLRQLAQVGMFLPYRCRVPPHAPCLYSHLTTLSCFSSSRMEISLSALLGTPSSLSSGRIS